MERRSVVSSLSSNLLQTGSSHRLDQISLNHRRESTLAIGDQGCCIPSLFHACFGLPFILYSFFRSVHSTSPRMLEESSLLLYLQFQGENFDQRESSFKLSPLHVHIYIILILLLFQVVGYTTAALSSRQSLLVQKKSRKLRLYS